MRSAPTRRRLLRRRPHLRRPRRRSSSPRCAVAPDVEVEAPPELRERLGKTRGVFAQLRGRNRIDDETWDDLEDTLLMADVGMPVTERILGDVKERAKAERTADSDGLMTLLHTELVTLLTSSPDGGDKPRTLTHTEANPTCGCSSASTASARRPRSPRSRARDRRRPHASCSPPPTRSGRRGRAADALGRGHRRRASSAARRAPTPVRSSTTP